jgi:argininosuccinate lyase
MDDTGRIRRPLTATTRRLVFPDGDADLAVELLPMTEVDRAHLVMLADQGLVERERAGAVLGEINRLRTTGFAPLRGRPARRGVYLLYEDWLIHRLGPDTGGVLPLARSRNDLNATVLRLRLREPWHRLLSEGGRLQAVLLRGARRHDCTVMPAYTHGQAALPTTYGHWLGGAALALERELEALEAAGADLGTCPLGAGAGAGTALPIDPACTASLLGFEQPVTHALDAVASRDAVLRLLAASAVLGVLCSRLAADLLAWTTAEFGFFDLPDELVGSSSMMPQKRNPFLLEHVQGRSAAALGAFVAAAGAMRGAPFANSVAVGTEGCRPVLDALHQTADAVTLLRLVIAGARPRPGVMLERARAGHTSATALADRLVVEAGLAYRQAHHRVGEMVADAEATGRDLVSVAAGRLDVPLDHLDPVDVARAARHGGGPGDPAPAALAAAARRWAERFTARRIR